MKVALAQIDIAWENKTANKEKCLKFLSLAHDNNITFIIFPEMCLTGFSMEVEKISEADNESIDWFKEQASKFNIFIGFGYAKKVNNKMYNSFAVIAPSGELLSDYSKIHPFSYGFEALYYEGGIDLSFSRINDFTISTFICYDLRFPEIFQIASKKAELITVAANWPISRRSMWIALLKARAIENQCYFAAVNRTGYGGNLTYFGDSMIVDPLGNVISNTYLSIDGAALSEPVSCEALIIGNIEIDTVRKLRNSFPLKKDRRENLYVSLYKKYY